MFHLEVTAKALFHLKVTANAERVARSLCELRGCLRVFVVVDCCETQRWLLNNLWSHHYEGAVTVVEEFLSECLNIVGGYAFEDAEILIFVVVTLVVVA